MKKLYLIRHAKSSWGDFTLPDFERPLNIRGKTDAPLMANRLLEKHIQIDAFVSSPAKRALKTCKYFCTSFGVKENKIIVVDSLYLASLQTFFDVVKALDNKYDRVAIFSHNPGITEFANRLCNEVHIDEMPTCSIFAVEMPVKKWGEFTEASNDFLFFDYPKK